MKTVQLSLMWMLSLWLFSPPIWAQSGSTVLTSPTKNEIFEPGTTVTLDANVSTSGASPVLSVQFYANGKLLGTDTSAPYSLAWKDVPSGGYVVSAFTTRDDGSVEASEGVYIGIVQTADPNLTSLLRVVDEQRWAHPGPIPVRTISPPEEGGNNLEVVELLVNGLNLTLETQPDFTFSIPNTGIGTYQIDATSTYAKGGGTLNATPKKIDVIDPQPMRAETERFTQTMGQVDLVRNHDMGIMKSLGNTVAVFEMMSPLGNPEIYFSIWNDEKQAIDPPMGFSSWPAKVSTQSIIAESKPVVAFDENNERIIIAWIGYSQAHQADVAFYRVFNAEGNPMPAFNTELLLDGAEAGEPEALRDITQIRMACDYADVLNVMTERAGRGENPEYEVHINQMDLNTGESLIGNSVMLEGNSNSYRLVGIGNFPENNHVLTNYIRTGSSDDYSFVNVFSHDLSSTIVEQEPIAALGSLFSGSVQITEENNAVLSWAESGASGGSLVPGTDAIEFKACIFKVESGNLVYSMEPELFGSDFYYEGTQVEAALEENTMFLSLVYGVYEEGGDDDYSFKAVNYLLEEESGNPNLVPSVDVGPELLYTELYADENDWTAHVNIFLDPAGGFVTSFDIIGNIESASKIIGDIGVIPWPWKKVNVYARLDWQQNPNLYLMSGNKFYVEYTTRKVDETLNFELIEDATKSSMGFLPPLQAYVGPNKYILDLSSFSLTNGGTYLLKVTNIEGDTEYLRIWNK